MKRILSLLLTVFMLASTLALTSCDSKPTVKPPQTIVIEITCPNCAHTNNAKNTFCGNCGALLNPSSDDTATDESESNTANDNNSNESSSNSNDNNNNNNNNNNVGDKTLKIGLSAPLTGPAAIYGMGSRNGAQLAVDEINARGGLKNGIKLELKVMDDRHDSTKVEGIYEQLMDWGMQVSLGCVTISPCREFAEISQKDNVFFMTPSASLDMIAADYDNGYQMCFADANQGAVAAAYVNALAAAGELGKLGIFYMPADPYSEGIYKQFVANLNKQVTGEPVVVATFDTHQVEQLKDCDFIFMPIYYTPAAEFMNAAKDKVANTAIYYGCDGFDGIDTSVELFDITRIPQKVTMLSQLDKTATEGKKGSFIENYTEAYGEESLHQFAACAYDAVYALVGAMNAAIDAGQTVDGNTTASALCEILKAQFQGDYEYKDAITANGNVTWDAEGFVVKSPLLHVFKEAD